MKTMTCQQLGGACEKEFHAETFEEMAQQSKHHGMTMLQQGDEAHIKAMEEMKKKMQSPEAMQQWFNQIKQTFKNLSS